MGKLPSDSVALVVTSPPYFVGKEYENEVILAANSQELVSDIPGSYGEYLDLLRDVFTECVRVLEPGGRIAVNVANLGRKPYRSLSADVIEIFERLGLLLRGEIIWRKAQASGGSCAWGSFRSPANPVLRDTTERIVVASKGQFDRLFSSAQRKRSNLPYESTLSSDEFVEATLDVWDIPAESARRVGHPAPFPVELPRRLIDLYTYSGDWVLDPFMGSGTTLVAALKAGRKGVGYDILPEYVEIARRRLKSARQGLSSDETPPELVGANNGVITVPPSKAERPSDDNFQRRAVEQGKKAQDLARFVLTKEAGFEIVSTKPRIGHLGIQFNFRIRNRHGLEWYVDVSGAFTTVRPGLQRTDTLWKTLGRAHVYFMDGYGKPSVDRTPILVMTSNLPKPRSEGRKALEAVGPESVFDAIEMFNHQDILRLQRYEEQETFAPIEGFWTREQIHEFVATRRPKAGRA